MKLKINSMADAYEYAVKVYKKMAPIMVIVFLVLGVVLLFALPTFKFIGFIMIGMAVFLAVLFTLMILFVSKKVKKLRKAEEENKEE